MVVKTGTPKKGALMAAAEKAEHPIPAPVAAEIKRVARRHQSRAFDNVDLERLLEAKPLCLADAQWIGRRLMRAGGGIETYESGQKILSLLEA